MTVHKHSWEIEAERLKHVYDGLKVQDCPPKYVFQGLSSHDYLMRFPHKKTQAIFLPGRFRPIMGGSSSIYYVKNGGSDSADGLSDADAWASLSKVSGSSFGAGDYVKFKMGSTFAGRLIVNWAGIQGSPITFSCYGAGALPIINATGQWYGVGNYGKTDKDHIVVEYLDIYSANDDAGRPATAYDADHWIIRYCVMRNCTGGCWFQSCTDFEIHDNVIHDCAGSVFDAIWVDDDSETGSDAFNIHHNEIYNCHGNGIAISETTNSEIHHSLIHDNDLEELYAGVATEANCTNGRIYHNLLYGNADGAGSILTNAPGQEIYNNTAWVASSADRYAIHLCDWSGSTPIGCVIKNNIFYTQTGKEIIRIGSNTNGTPFDEFDNVWDNNILYGDGLNSHIVTTNAEGDLTWTEWRAEGFEAHGQHTDPLLMNVAGDDYHLKSNSPAVNAGVDVGLETDLDGIPIGRGPAPDIGCYETLKGGPRGL
jgi:hypothetical protein